jgi:lysophospholipase L1-like esterase
MKRIVLSAVAGVLAIGVGVGAQVPKLDAAADPAAAPSHWVGSWTASPSDSSTPTDAGGLPVPAVLADQTLRMVITPHLGGTTLRLHLSNRFGRSPAQFGHVTIGLSADGTDSNAVPVTFGGSQAVSIPAGMDAISDPVNLTFSAFSPLAVSMFVPGLQLFPTKHWDANATSFYSLPGSGDLTASPTDADFAGHTEAWLYVDGLDVEAPTETASIVAFGDSITDGFVAANAFSLPASQSIMNENGRYPDDLQRRLIDAGIPLSVVDAGIAGNRVVTDGEPQSMGLSALQRFQQDALDVPGVKGVIFTEGINDLGLPPARTTPDLLVAGYEQIIAMAHAAGVKIWIGTLSPASNAIFDGTLTAPQSEVDRELVNAWIRSQHLADGVVDFDAALRDPSNPTVLNPAYSGPDHLHPNLAGYQVMADTVSLAMLGSAL